MIIFYKHLCYTKNNNSCASINVTLAKFIPTLKFFDFYFFFHYLLIESLYRNQEWQYEDLIISLEGIPNVSYEYNQRYTTPEIRWSFAATQLVQPLNSLLIKQLCITKLLAFNNYSKRKIKKEKRRSLFKFLMILGRNKKVQLTKLSSQAVHKQYPSPGRWFADDHKGESYNNHQ